MPITKNVQRIYQIFKDESAIHTALPPIFLPDWNFAFDEDEILEGVFVERTTSTDDKLDVYTDGSVYLMDDVFTPVTLSHNGVDYNFDVFGFTLVVQPEPEPEIIPEVI